MAEVEDASDFGVKYIVYELHCQYRLPSLRQSAEGESYALLSFFPFDVGLRVVGECDK